MIRLAPIPAPLSYLQRRNRQSPQPGRIISHHRQRTWPLSGAALQKRTGGARRAAHVSRRVHPGPFPDAGSIGGPRRLPPRVSSGGARIRGGIPAKSCGREGAPSRLPRRARPSSGPTQDYLFQLANTSRSAALQRQLEEAEENRSRTRRGDLNEVREREQQALPLLRAVRDHRQRPGVPQPKRVRRYYGQKDRRNEPALVRSELISRNGPPSARGAFFA